MYGNERWMMNTIRDTMTVDVITVIEDQSLEDIVKTMADKNISCVVVVKGERPIGIITERDLVKRVLYKREDMAKIKAKDVMTSPVISISPDIQFGDALSVMESNKLRRLVVVEDDSLAGVVTNTDIVSKTRSINNYNKKLEFYQNIQTYFIFIFFLFIVVYFVVQFLL